MRFRVFHYKLASGQPNFGDDLNPWLWPKIDQKLFSGTDDSDPIFLGIGTLLNERIVQLLNNNHKITVFGSGYGYADAAPKLGKTWEVICVRGPVTAAALGLPKEVAVADPAILASTIYPAKSPTNRIAFMPHITQAMAAGDYWKMIAEDMGIDYIDPRDSIEKVIDSISGSRLLLTEALHGAIVADSFRVPWVPLKSHPGILDTKWVDWCQSMNLEYSPIKIPPLWPSVHATSAPRAILDKIRKGVKLTLAKKKISRLRYAKPLLSSHSLLRDKIDRLKSLLENVRRGA